MSEERFTFFWSGPFSQWASCAFVVDGVEYNCAEQYMMAEKARIFKDEEMLTLIMLSTNPRTQKLLGRQVRNFDEKIWNCIAKEVVFEGNFAKFSQNPDLKKALLATKGTILVEASPYDQIWGIGLLESDPRAQSRDTWLGRNWLGEVLTDVREAIINAKDNETT